MDIRLWLQEVAILIVVCKIAAEQDPLESFLPKEENPQELNEFLHNVLEHKNDFSFVREAARKYQKMKKEITVDDTLNSIMDPNDAFLDSNKIYNKRHVLHYNGKRKFRNLGLLPPNMRKKFSRIRRHSSEILDEDLDEEKTMPKVILLQRDDSVQKRMQTEELEPHVQKHLPSDIFVNPGEEKIEKRTPDEIIIANDGEKGMINIQDDMKIAPKEKKQAIDLSNSVHHGYKNSAGKVMRTDMRSANQHQDVYYVDLQDAAEKEKEKHGDKKRFEWEQKGQEYYHYPERNQMYNHPMPMQRPENNENSQYDNRLHHNINDEVAFEKALSYEIGPKYQDLQDMYNNNPAGNNLYAVDEGRSDNIQPLYPQNGYHPKMQSIQGGAMYDYPPQDPSVTNEKFFIDNSNNMRRLETTTESTTNLPEINNVKANIEGTGKKNVQQVGKGFIEITKARRDNENMEMNEIQEEPMFIKKSFNSLNENNDIGKQRIDDITEENKRQSVLSKNSLHPLRIKDTSQEESEETFVPNDQLIDDMSAHELDKRDVKNEDHFKSRKLQFFDPDMGNLYSHDESYEEMPVRNRRDFLDALGMKNEEDYSEDNPYVNEMHANNTDIHNDTCIQNHTTKHSCQDTTTASTISHRQEDFNNIKGILEDMSNITGITPKYKRKKKKVKTKLNRPKKSFKDFEDLDEEKTEEMRDPRATNKEIETKIFENKDKIYSIHDNNPNLNLNNHVQVRQDKLLSKWNTDLSKLNIMKKLLPASHKIDKKEDFDLSYALESTEMTDVPDTSPDMVNVTDSDVTTNSAYEQIAHQMDVENEKLAQVVNGHLASKIVTIVFDNLRKKNTLKAKFYSGLSRKHVNFAGTIDFDIFKSNETEDVDEAHLLLDQVAKVLNKLVVNQVRRKLCQRLPDELKDYLDIILNVKNNLENQNYVPNPQQGSFLFQYQDVKNKPPFDLNQMQSILVQLEQLLLNYQSLSEDCQNRAEPVKDYIEKHVKMLKQIVNCPSHNCDDKFATAKRNTPYRNNPLVERQLESVGLGRNQEFIPNFDLDQLVRSKLKLNGWKNERKRDLQKSIGHKSQQYRKLQEAAERIRDKRENEKKIAEMFGGKEKRSAKKLNVDYEEPVVYSLG